VYKTKEVWIVSYLYTVNVPPDRVEYHGGSGGTVFFVYDDLPEEVGVALEAAFYSGDDRLTVNLSDIYKGFTFCNKWLKLAQRLKRSFKIGEVNGQLSNITKRGATKELPPKTISELSKLLELNDEGEKENGGDKPNGGTKKTRRIGRLEFD